MIVRTMVRSKVCYCQHASMLMLGVTASASTIYESYISPVSVICQSDISHIYFCDGSAQMRRRTCVFQQLDITFGQRKLCQTFCLGFWSNISQLYIKSVGYFCQRFSSCLSKEMQLFIKEGFVRPASPGGSLKIPKRMNFQKSTKPLLTI